MMRVVCPCCKHEFEAENLAKQTHCPVCGCFLPDKTEIIFK